jgi:hypothetical protein
MVKGKRIEKKEGQKLLGRAAFLNGFHNAILIEPDFDFCCFPAAPADGSTDYSDWGDARIRITRIFGERIHPTFRRILGV